VRGLVKADLLGRENELQAIVSPPVLHADIHSAWMDCQGLPMSSRNFMLDGL
jgi:hypothetical protein